MMLSELIEKNTAKVADFKVREDAALKSSEQHNIDVNFTKAIASVKQTVDHLCSVRDEADFVESKNVSGKIKEMLEICKNAASQDHVTVSDTATINGLSRDINSTLTDEWKQYYDQKTSSIREILGIARNLSSNEVTILINDITSASRWEVNVKEVTKMIKAIDEANVLIDKLELNDTIVKFLKKMVDQKASLDDLSKEVMEWLDKEDLMKRVKLSFGQ